MILLNIIITIIKSYIKWYGIFRRKRSDRYPFLRESLWFYGTNIYYSKLALWRWVRKEFSY